MTIHNLVACCRKISARAWLGLAVSLLALVAACGDVKSDVTPDAAPPPLADNGAACDSDAQCESGTCAQHVCCGTACEGACSRCDLEGSRGTCTPVAADTACGTATCDEGQLTPPARCDGHGACVAEAAETCGAYVCADDHACATACTTGSNDACSNGNVCAQGMCAPPTCSDHVRSAPETGVDCGGGACPRCTANQGCLVGTDCESGTCNGGTCTAPTYTWRTTSFGTCGAGACSVGVQTRNVWCERSDGTTVSDAMCTTARPTQTQSCTNTAGCTWAAGSYGTCSARCGGGTQVRPVYCRDGVGAQVPSSWCTGTPPTSTASCNNFACVVNVAAGPSGAMGPCWSPPNCLGGYPAYPSCPAGYAPTRSETACGNPNTCNGNWALCTFLGIAHYGCADPTYVMGVAVRECTYQ